VKLMPNKAWKNLERRVAHKFGGKRNPYSGSVDIITGADIINHNILPNFFIECKMRNHFHHHTLFTAIEGKAIQENKKALLITHVKSQRDDLLVLIRLNDFIDLMGGD